MDTEQHTKKDRHLNVFYSYDRGSLNDLEKLCQLEDNVTRSFIITLSQLNKKSQYKFLNQLLCDNGLNYNLNEKSPLFFDLQNLSEDSDRKIIKEAKFKCILLIARHRPNIRKADINNAKDSWKEIQINQIYEESRKQRKAEEKEANDYNSTLQAQYEMKRDKHSRPDAWIFNNNIALLVESKIANNSQSTTQIYRHLTDEHGFNLDPKSDYEIIKTSWKRIVEILEDIIDNKLSNEINLFNQFKEYLIMIGENLSFEPIITGKNNTFTSRSNILKLLVSELVGKINSDSVLKNLNLKPERKTISGHAWQQLGSDKNLHFSIYVDEDNSGIGLTFRDKYINLYWKQWGKYFPIVWSNFLKNGYIEEEKSHRYLMYFKEYHIFDYYRGLETTDKRDEFKMVFDMEWVRRKETNEEKINNFLFNLCDPIFPTISQFGIQYRIPYPNLKEIKRREKANKPRPRYKKDYYMLRDPELVVNDFHKFIVAMKPVFEKMLNI